ncbi:MAG: hypothetical protein RL095_3934 [Verrucomicrobiota bacterium]
MGNGRRRVAPLAGGFLQVAVQGLEESSVKIIPDVQPLSCKAFQGVPECRRSIVAQPRSRAPRILFGLRHQLVLDRISVNITETSQIGLLQGETSVVKLIPDSATRRVIHLIQEGRGIAMKAGKERANQAWIGRKENGVIVVAHQSPGLQLNAMFISLRKKLPFQNIELLGRVPKSFFVQRAAGDDISPGFREMMNRGMRPVSLRCLIGRIIH